MEGFEQVIAVAASMVGMERKKENSSAAVRDMPATCPAAIVDMERDVPGNTADATWQMPIQMAWTSETSSMRSVMWRPTVRGEPKYASTIHITMPPTSSETPITVRLSRCLPMSLVSRSDGTGGADKRNHHQCKRMRERGAVLAFTARKRRQEAGNPRTKINRQAENGAQLDHDGVHLPERIVEVDVQQRLGDAQVGRGADRQKFR